MIDFKGYERAERVAEFSPGWSERSEAEPWVTTPINHGARFSGRQSWLAFFCRPLKRANKLLCAAYPGLRSACPGLNSAAGCAAYPGLRSACLGLNSAAGCAGSSTIQFQFSETNPLSKLSPGATPGGGHD